MIQKRKKLQLKLTNFIEGKVKYSENKKKDTYIFQWLENQSICFMRNFRNKFFKNLQKNVHFLCITNKNNNYKNIRTSHLTYPYCFFTTKKFFFTDCKWLFCFVQFPSLCLNAKKNFKNIN